MYMKLETVIEKLEEKEDLNKVLQQSNKHLT